MNLPCVVIGPDRVLTSQLLLAFKELGGIAVLRDLAQYPQDREAIRMVRSIAPKFICLDLSDKDRSFALIELLQSEFPGIQIAVFNETVEPQLLLKLMQHGIREYIAPPFEADQLAAVLIRLRDAALKHPITPSTTNFVYSFLPSKPGSGTTTLAINTAVAMSKYPDANSLLMDLDLNSGLVRFLLKLDNEHTILEAARHATAMDEALWSQLVCPVGNLDVIHTARITPGIRIEVEQARALIDYVRKQYKAICVDLSGNMERYSMEIMQESKSTFIVCTPEIPSLHLALEKFQFLKAEGLGEKVKFLLNRHSRSDLLQIEQIQNLLGAPVALTFANDYGGVSQAVADGKQIAPNSELGRQISAFAGQLLERAATAPDDKAKKKEIRGFGELFKFGASRIAQLSDSESNV